MVIGASGGIGSALVERLSADRRCAQVLSYSRTPTPVAEPIDVTDEASVIAAAAHAKAQAEDGVDLVVSAVGVLTINGQAPEKALSQLDPAIMAEAFAVNAIGPALALKHFAPLLPRRRRSLIGVLTAKVGSVSDNRLGGWVSYRAAKAAANQIVRTAAIEIQRTRPMAVCVALQPGTVATKMSDPYAGARERLSPDQSATRLLSVLDGLAEADTGGFFDHAGQAIAW